MDFIKWMFGSFWRFIGVCVLACVFLDGGASLLLALRGKAEPAECASVSDGGSDMRATLQ